MTSQRQVRDNVINVTMRKTVWQLQ